MKSTTYSRVYHRLMTEYPSVWKSDSQLALLVRLLVAADKFYPEWPTSNRRNGAYQSLLKAGLVIEQKGTNGYTVRGLEAERKRRSHAASNAAASRWGMPRTVEKRIEEKIGANGTQPETFLRFPPKREAGMLADQYRHEGQHANCDVCAAVKT